ncbi:hypothetical protein C0J52_17519 [Blattella germanica]|nr:hypothetical protein C0J52_17519 [Blattella germanica]
MVLRTGEKIFIYKRYLESYGIGRQNGCSLHHVKEYYNEQFNKLAPSNTTLLAIFEKFRCTFCVHGSKQLNAQGPKAKDA